MSNYLGDFTYGQKFSGTFETYNGAGASITYTGGTIKLFRYGPDFSAAPHSAENGDGDTDLGITVTIDKDNVDVGTHQIKIDTTLTNGNNRFFPLSDFFVKLVGATVDGQTVTKTIAQFSLHNRGTYLTKGLAQTGSSGTQLVIAAADRPGAAGVPLTDTGVDAFRTSIVRILYGTGAGQSAKPTTYTTATGTLLVSFPVALDNTSVFVIEPDGLNLVSATEQTNDIADAVWDEAQAGHTTAGTYGIIHQTTRDEILNRATASHVTAGSVGQVLNNLPNDGALTNLDAAISTRATPAQVNTEVLDVLNVDTWAELGAVPADVTTLRQMIAWIYVTMRHEGTQSATTRIVKNGAGATVGTAPVSEAAGTVTRGKFV